LYAANGPGVINSISGQAIEYAKGGVGGASVYSPGAEGTGNGGAGGLGAGNGGSGGVIVRYPKDYIIANPGGGLVYTTVIDGLDKATLITAGIGNIMWS
jgi:hypothetical protein